MRIGIRRKGSCRRKVGADRAHGCLATPSHDSLLAASATTLRAAMLASQQYGGMPFAEPAICRRRRSRRK
jgi:hypothetical protein